MKWRKVEVGVTWDESTFETMEEFPRDPCSPETENGSMEPKYLPFPEMIIYTPKAHHLTFGEPGIPRDLETG